MPNVPVLSPDPAADVGGDVAELVHSVARRIRLAANRDLDPFGVTPAQVRALRTIARCDGAVRMSDLADRLRIARRSTTSVVDELVERGLVARQADSDDRRAVVVDVTTDGQSLLATLADRRRQAAGELTSRLSRRDLDALRALLRRLDSDS